MSYYSLPLENIIFEIVSKKQKIDERELIEELNKRKIMVSPSELNNALIKLEFYEKIIVYSQKDTKIIMIRQ
ncbi:MAG: hypothetical protein RQ922_02790 [Thermoproteota archaeon]|jgi:hypothetical protein|nr:hypothetical protein [Thermoproteota archaeon]